MKYPIMTLIDETEITASGFENNSVQIYAEKWDEKKDCFNHLTIFLPEEKIYEITGFTKKEAMNIIQHISNLKKDIMNFVKEQEEINATIDDSVRI